MKTLAKLLTELDKAVDALDTLNSSGNAHAHGLAPHVQALVGQSVVQLRSKIDSFTVLETYEAMHAMVSGMEKIAPLRFVREARHLSRRIVGVKNIDQTDAQRLAQRLDQIADTVAAEWESERKSKEVFNTFHNAAVSMIPFLNIPHRKTDRDMSSFRPAELQTVATEMNEWVVWLRYFVKFDRSVIVSTLRREADEFEAFATKPTETLATMLRKIASEIEEVCSPT